MALSLTCACGARFEVEDTLAGQEVSCPECQQSLKAPALQRVPLRTSGFALASAQLALVGAFTVIGTLAAVVLGAVALVSIARHRDRLAGVGFAVFGILAGTLFTAVTLVALGAFEIFGGVSDFGGWMHERALADQVDRDGPNEIVLPLKRFAITRPSDQWGQARANQVDDPAVSPLQKNRDLLLVRPARYAFVDVRVDTTNPWPGMDPLSADIVQSDFDTAPQPANRRGFPGPADDDDDDNPFVRVSDLKVFPVGGLKTQGNVQWREFTVDVRCGNRPWRLLVRLYKKTGGPLYIVRGYTEKGRFNRAEAELRKALDSFRVLP